MGAVPSNTGLVLLLFVFISVIIHIEAASRTGRTYGTWVDRLRQRICQRGLICGYRERDCLNSTPDNQWECTALNNAMIAKKCILNRCDKSKGMMCLDVAPGENMIRVFSDVACPVGTMCYAPAIISTATQPNGKTDTTTAGPAVTGTDTTRLVLTVTTANIADENATDTIWTSAVQDNSTLIP